MSCNKLSKEQELAINHFNGPALVVAGPGSGKTTVIINRINNLIYQRQVRPENILVITFSKMAALSMQERFNNSGSNLSVTFGTFHSVFYNIIRQSSSQKLKVVSYKQKHELLISVLTNLNFNDNTDIEFLDSILKRISFYKNSNYKKDNTTLCNIDDQRFMLVFDAYNSSLNHYQLIDFDDMMLMCNKLLDQSIKIREKYQSQFKYVLIDEFQDINDLQFEIIKKLITEGNIFAVGDDDQSIYGFRGSNPIIMKEFKKYYPDAKVIKLNCNYRSQENIIALACRLIRNNKIRIEKEIFAHKKGESCAEVLCFEDEQTQNNEIITRIRNSQNRNFESNFCILYRNNISVSKMVERLISEKIECEVIEKAHNPFSNIIFRDFCSYKKMAESDAIKVNDFIAVMNKPVRYISRKDIIGRYVDLTLLRGIYKEKEYVTGKIKKLENDLKFIRNMDLYSAFYYFRKVIGYEEYLEQIYIDDNDLLNKQKDYIEVMQEKLRLYKDLSEVEAVSDKIDSLKDNNKIIISPGKVYVMTYHASKGLEFDNVWIPDLMEGECPSSKSITEEAIEEERRMLYVAMTRAKFALSLSYIRGNGKKNMLKSRFVDELEK